MNRRRTLATLAAATISSSFAACGPVNRGTDPRESAANKAPVTITAWHAARATPDLTARSADMLKRFEDESRYIKVNWQVVQWSGALAMLARLPIAAAAGDLPDTFRSHWSIHGSVINQGWLRPTDAYMKEARLSRNQFTPSTWDLTTWRGKGYGMPTSAYPIAIAWNKDLFESSGLQRERPPSTMDELLDFSVRLHRASASAAPAPNAANAPTTTGPEIAQTGWTHKTAGVGQFVVMFGAQVWDAAKERVTPDHPGVVDALTWSLNLLKRQGGWTKVEDFWKAKAPNPFFGGATAFTTSTPRSGNEFAAAAANLRYGVALFPGKRGARQDLENTVVQAEVMPITQTSKNPDETWQLLRWLFVQNGADWGAASLMTPCLISAMDPFLEKIGASARTNALSPYVDVFRDITRRGSRYWPTMPRTNEYLTAFTDTWNNVLQEKATPEAALRELARTEQLALEQVLKPR